MHSARNIGATKALWLNDTSGDEDDERSAPTPDRDDATFPIMFNDKLIERSLLM
jgi:hypothetical protein